MIDGQRRLNVTLALAVRKKTPELTILITTTASESMRTSNCATWLDGLLFAIDAKSKITIIGTLVTTQSHHGATKLSMVTYHQNSQSASLRTKDRATIRIGLNSKILAI